MHTFITYVYSFSLILVAISGILLGTMLLFISSNKSLSFSIVTCLDASILLSIVLTDELELAIKLVSDVGRDVFVVSCFLVDGSIFVGRVLFVLLLIID